ncbi:MAG: hypothetical protein ACFFCF_02595 [Promethearchaeota archaeon]
MSSATMNSIKRTTNDKWNALLLTDPPARPWWTSSFLWQPKYIVPPPTPIIPPLAIIIVVAVIVVTLIVITFVILRQRMS